MAELRDLALPVGRHLGSGLALSLGKTPFYVTGSDLSGEVSLLGSRSRLLCRRRVSESFDGCISEAYSLDANPRDILPARS